MKFGPEARLLAHCFTADKFYFTLSDKYAISAEFGDVYFDFNGGNNVVGWILNGDIIQFLRELSKISPYPKTAKSQLILAVGERTEDKVLKLKHQFASLPSSYWPPRNIDIFILYEHSSDHFWGIQNRIGADVFDNCPELSITSRTNDVYTINPSEINNLWQKFISYRARSILLNPNP